jgi:DNA primase
MGPIMALLSSRGRIDTEALKRDRPLADVIASYGVALRREGSGTYRGLCPFHQEHSPSFWVDVRDQSNEHYFCFGACGAHGDVITFVMEREGCSFAEACELLSSRGKPPVVEPAARTLSRPLGPKWESIQPDSVEIEVLDLALRSYEEQLWGSHPARAYLRTRGIPEEIARSQRVGYADGRSLINRVAHASLRTSDTETALAVAARIGLIVERPSDDDGVPLRREFFNDRLVIPELRDGKPIWMIGRAVESNLASAIQAEPTGTRSSKPRPKYLGLPGEKPLIGLEHVVGRRTAFLVEGPLDWLAAVAWGLPAFALCGTHFPTERMPALADAIAVYGLFDPDRAGRSAAERFAPLFGSRWRPVRLPNSLDLAELAALGGPGRETLRLLVGRARAAAWHDGHG